MTDSVGPWWEKCKELLVVPVPSGLLVLTRRTLQADDPQAALLKLAAIAASRPRWDDAVALWLDHGPQTMSGPVREYLRSKVTTGLVRKDQLVAVPWPWPGVHDTRDAPAANLPANAHEHLGDFYGVPVHISPEPTGPPRNAAVDDNRLQTSREATAPGGQKPSPQHPDQYLHQYLDQLDKVRAQLRDPGPNSDGSVRTFSESDHPALWWVMETNDDASESAANLAPRTNDSRIAAPQDPAAGVATADPAGRVVTADMLPTPIPNKPPAHPDLVATPGIEAVEPIHAGLYLPGLGGGEQARYAAQKLPRFDGYTTIAASLDPAAGKVVTPTGSYSPRRFNDLLTRHGVAPDARLILVICEAAGAADPSQRFAEGLFAVRNAELLAGNAVAWASPHDDDVLLGELSIDPNGVPRIHARGDLLSFMPGQAEPARLGPRLRAAMASLGAAGTRSPTSSRQTELVHYGVARETTASSSSTGTPLGFSALTLPAPPEEPAPTPDPLTDIGQSPHGYLSIGSIGELREGTEREVQRLAVDAWVRYIAGPSPLDDRQRAAIRGAVEELLTKNRLLTDMPSLVGRRGGVYIVGTGRNAIRLMVKVRLHRRDEPGLLPSMPDPQASQGEVRYHHRTSATVQHSNANFRDVPLNKRFNVDLGAFAENHWLRRIPLVPMLQSTYNQWKRQGSALISAGHLVIIRNREPNYGYFYDAQWSVEAAPLVPPAPIPGAVPGVASSVGEVAVAVALAPVLGRQEVDEGGVAADTSWGSLKVYFPEHIAKPQPEPNYDWRVDLTAAPMVLDTLHDPSSVSLELLDRFRNLDLDSQKHLLVFAGHDNLQSGWLGRLRRGGLVSDPLYTSSGLPLGVLRLKAELRRGEVVSRSTNAKLEFFNQGLVEESGSSAIYNALIGGLQVGFTVSDQPLSADSYTSFPPMVTARWGRASEYGSNAGGSAAIGRGFKSGGDAARGNAPFGSLVADVDVAWTAELLTPAGPPRTHEWRGAATDRAGARVRFLAYTLHPPSADRNVYAPAGVVNGDALGLVAVNGFETVADLDGSVRTQLIERGYLAGSGAGGPRQMVNHRRFLDVVDASYRETLADDLLGDGIWVPFEKESRSGGVERVMVRWIATTLPHTQPTYHGYTTDLGLEFNGDTSQALDGTHRSVRIVNLRGEIDVNVPIKRSTVSTIPVAVGPYQYVNERSETVSGGVSTGRSVEMQSEAGERLHKFTAGLQLRAEIYEMRYKQPTWQVAAPQDATVDIWVPDFRVQEQPVPRVESLPAPTGRPVTLQDRELLNRPAAQVMSSLPGLAAVRGSKTLNQVFHDLLTEQFGDPSDWFSRGLFGPRPSDQTSVSAQQRRAFVSPLRLFGSLAQVLRGAYSSESYQWGAVSGPEYRIELRAYVSGRPRLVPPRKKESSFYIEEGALLSRPSGTADGTAVTHQVAGQGGPTVKLPHDVVPGIQVSGRYGRTSNTSSSDSSQGTDYRIHTYTGRQYTVTLPLTFIATLHGAARNLLTSVMSLAGKGSTVSEQALDVADGIEAHMSISELAALLRTMRQVEPETPDGRLILGLGDQRNQSLLTELQRLNDVYEADQAALRAHREPDRDLDTVVYLPRRIAGRLGLGDAVIADVLLDPQRSARVLLDSGLELVEQLVPGATRLGSNTYAAGLHTNLADLTEPLAMRGGVPRYFNSGQTERPVELNQFTVYTAQRGRALAITVKLLARPAQEFETDDDLRKIFGRQVPEADLEIHSLARRTQTRGHGAGSTSAQTATLSAAVPHAPAAVLRDFSPSLAGSHIRDVGRSADETYRHEDRFVTKTVDGSARAEIPFELAIGVTVEPVREVPGPLQVVPALLETAIRMLGPHHAALDRVGEWVGGHAVVEFIAEDGSRQPVTAQPPAGYHAPTVFGVNPMQHDGQGLPHQAGGGPLPGFQLHDVRAWAPYGGPPPQHKLSWFNGDQVLPDLATQVLPDNARFAEGAREIQRFVEGLAGAANSYRLLSQGGVTHTVTSRNWGMSMVYEGTLQIQVIAASPWRVPVDTLDTGTGEAAPIAVGEHTRAISEHFPSKAASSSASFNADRQLGLRAQASSDVGSPTSGSSHGPLTYATVALTGGETSGVGATTFGATRRALRLYPTDLTRNMLKQRDLLLVVKGSTRTRPLGWFTWGEPSVSERWLAATMETRVNQSFLPAERTTRTPTGLHLPSLGDTEADDERWRQQPGYDRWVFVDGKGVATRTGTRASGLTAPDIHEALNSHGFSAEEDLILSIDQASFRGDRSLAAELGRLRPNARILATDLPNTHGHANPTPWRLFTDGAMGHDLVPDLDRSVQVAESRPPDNTRYAGPVLAVDSGNSWQGAAVTPEQIAALARQARRPVVAINVRPGLTENGPELTALRAVLQRFQWFGMRPTVVATGVTAEFERAIDRYQPITIQLRSVGLGQVWRVADPSGTVLAQDAELTAALFDNGDRVPVAVDGGGLPPVLAGWLAQNTWPESEAFLRDNVSRLLDPRVEVALRELRQREPGDERIGAYDVILGLVGKAGDLASPLQARWRPDQPGQPLRETFALDYLLPKATREERKAWDDRLLSLMSTGELSTAQMVALARGVHEVGERTVVVAGERHMERFDYGPANATMFTAVSDVLNLQPEMIQRLTDSTDPAAEEGPFKNALTQVAACRLLPSDKTAWVERIDELRTGLRAKQQALAALLNILLQKMVAC